MSVYRTVSVSAADGSRLQRLDSTRWALASSVTQWCRQLLLNTPLDVCVAAGKESTSLRMAVPKPSAYSTCPGLLGLLPPML